MIAPAIKVTVCESDESAQAVIEEERREGLTETLNDRSLSDTHETVDFLSEICYLSSQVTGIVFVSIEVSDLQGRRKGKVSKLQYERGRRLSSHLDEE